MLLVFSLLFLFTETMSFPLFLFFKNKYNVLLGIFKALKEIKEYSKQNMFSLVGRNALTAIKYPFFSPSPGARLKVNYNDKFKPANIHNLNQHMSEKQIAQQINYCDLSFKDLCYLFRTLKVRTST